MSTTVAGTTSIRPTRTYTTLWDVTERIRAARRVVLETLELPVAARDGRARRAISSDEHEHWRPPLAGPDPAFEVFVRSQDGSPTRAGRASARNPHLPSAGSKVGPRAGDSSHVAGGLFTKEA
jgi:hypothetical protein